MQQGSSSSFSASHSSPLASHSLGTSSPNSMMWSQARALLLLGAH